MTRTQPQPTLVKRFLTQDLTLPSELAANPRLRARSLQGTVLALMVRRRFERLEALSSLDGLENAAPKCCAGRARPARSFGCFEKALAAPGRRFIFEVKTASPSEGVMKADFGPQALEQLVTLYERFTDAVSVLVEPDFFGGSFERLSQVRALTGKPILAKDIVVDERRILAAKAAGADAVLLMLSVLSDEGYAQLAQFAQSLGLDVLTEVHDELELAAAARMGARVIGINNRNLKTLATDFGSTLRLASLVPKDRVLVSESGFMKRDDILLLESGLSPKHRTPDAYLIGSAVTKAREPSAVVRELVFGRVKVCGITRPDDAAAAALSGASAIGLILAKRSKRAVSLDAAPTLAKAVRARCAALALPVEIVAVLDAEEALDLAFAAALAGNRPDLAAALEALIKEGAAESFLLDAASPQSGAAGRTGGTGAAFEHNVLDRLPALERIAVAGGLAPGNIARLARRVPAPMEIDVNSGVESSLGIKSRALLEAFFNALRASPGASTDAPKEDQYEHEARHANA